MATQLIIPRQLDANGDASSGAKAYVYETATTIGVTVYTDTALSVAHATPIVADSAGYFAQAFYGGALALKVVVKSATDTTLVTYDPVPLVSLSTAAAADVTFAPTTEIPETDVQAAIVSVEASSEASSTAKDAAVVAAIEAKYSGLDASIITGTAGTSGNVATWNADGDVVDGGSVPLVQTTGTFTPTFSVDAGTFTASTSDMSYWRIGNIVHLQGEFNLTTVSGVSGPAVQIVGLPYSFSKGYNGATTMGWLDQSGTTGQNYTVLHLSGSTFPGEDAVIRRSASSFAAGDLLWFSGSYPTDDAV